MRFGSTLTLSPPPPLETTFDGESSEEEEEGGVEDRVGRHYVIIGRALPAGQPGRGFHC